MNDAAAEIRGFKTFNGHAVVKGVKIGYEHLDIKYTPKKTPLENYIVKIHPDRTSFTAVPKGLY